MCEPNMNMPVSPSPSPLPSSSILPATPRCTSKLAKRMQEDTCYLCRQKGHWSWYCPLKSPDAKALSPSTNHDSPVSTKMIQCRCGHGSCEVKTTLSERNRGRKYFACPIKRGAKCKGFVKWCDDPIDESDLQPPLFKYPECECGAGVCRRVKGTDSTDAVKYYFTCPVREDHGSCGYHVLEDELLRNKSIVCMQQSSQRTLHHFWGNDKTDNDLGKDLAMGGDLLVQPKRVKIMGNSENLSLMAVSKIPEPQDAALKPVHTKYVGFPEFDAAHDDLELTNSVSWDIIEAESFLLSRLSTPSRIHHRQREFQRHIFADTVADALFDPCPTGWLGRLLFFHPTQSLKFCPPQPFFCCVFPSFNPIIVPKEPNIPGGPCEGNQLAVSSLSPQSQLSTGCHTEVSRDVVCPNTSTGSIRKPMSKAQRHRQVVLFAQQQLLIDLETLGPHEFESMREEAEATFALLDKLGVNYKQFSEYVWDFINLTSSVAEIDKSIEKSLTLEEHNKRFEEEKVRLAHIQDDCVKTEDLLEVSNQQRLLLCEQISHLEAMLCDKQNQLKSCELETLKIETHLNDLKRSMLEAEITLKDRAEQAEVARKQSAERQAKQIGAKSALEKAKLDLEN